MNKPFSDWLAEEGITLVVADGKVFSDPAVYIVPEDSLTRVLVRVTGESVEDFESKIKGKQIVARKAIIQCPNNWGENYEFSEEGLT